MSERQSRFRDAKDEVSLLRWVFGWHPIVSPVVVVVLFAGIGYYFRATNPAAMAGLVLAVPIWYQGARYINRHAASIREGYEADVEEYGPVVLEAAGMDEDADQFILHKIPDDTQPFIEAPSQVDMTIVGVDDTGVWIYDETTLDLMFLKAALGTEPDNVIRFPWSNLESVDFEDGDLVVTPIEETDEIEIYRTPLGEEPQELLSTVKARIQSGH
ncbi:hypothetical protein [Halodesulfurarchaeum sp.]|uniref:hypothetical protein n=1 Tax=Halodesulfurarchaeum sp. TaxID=1980530 RepID=UPI001BC5419C|nr:hypothetical protein [Halodesulfurarchaeum sp.]